MRIKFDKVDGFIKVYDGTRYLVLFGPERHDSLYDRIRYLISQKSGITYSIDHNFARIRINSHNSLPTEKASIFRDAIILVKSVFNKNQNYYYYHIYLEKDSYDDESYRQFF